MFKNTFDYCKRCEVYQTFINKFTVSDDLHPIPPLRPFEKWSIDLIGDLPIIKRRFCFIVIATDYLTKFTEVRALKISVKNEVARFVYEWIVIHFGILLEIVSNNRPQFTSDVWKDFMERLAIIHRFTTIYKLSTNGLVEQTNKTLCSMLAKNPGPRANASDRDFKIHDAMWAYNSTFKRATRFSPFHLAYDIKAFFPIAFEFMTCCTTFKVRLDLEES